MAPLIIGASALTTWGAMEDRFHSVQKLANLGIGATILTAMLAVTTAIADDGRTSPLTASGPKQQPPQPGAEGIQDMVGVALFAFGVAFNVPKMSAEMKN